MRKANSLGDAWLISGVIFASRVLVLLALAAVTHGREISDDASMHLRMILDPLQLLAGTTHLDGQHPPLLPSTMALVASPLRWLKAPPFYALRLTFAFYEAIAAGLTWHVLSRIELSPRQLIARAALLVLSPLGWVASTVMSQDETVAATFFVLVLWQTLEDHRLRATFTASIGALAGKALLLVPLLALLLGAKPGQRARGLAVGVGPLVVAYGWVCLAAVTRNQPLPFATFRPSATYCTTAWTLLLSRFELNTVVALSTTATAIGCVAVILLCRTSIATATGMVATCVALVLTTFALHYHINPEYYVMVVPGMLMLRHRHSVVLSAALGVLPWSVNFFSGVANAKSLGSHAGAKQVFVRLYDAAFGSLDIATLHASAIIATTLVTLASAAVALRCARRELDASRKSTSSDDSQKRCDRTT